MVDQRGRDPHVLIPHHCAAVPQLVHVDQRRYRNSALVGDAGSMSAAFISKNSRVSRSSGLGPQVSIVQSHVLELPITESYCEARKPMSFW